MYFEPGWVHWRQGLALNDDVLQRVRSSNDPIPVLSISLNLDTEEVAEAAGLAIKSNSHIEHLNLRGIFVRPDRYESLIRGISQNTSIKVLYISNVISIPWRLFAPLIHTMSLRQLTLDGGIIDFANTPSRK